MKIEDKSFLKRYGVQIADSSDSESAIDLSSGKKDSLASQEDSLASPLEVDGHTPQALGNLTSQADYNFFPFVNNKEESLYQFALEATDPCCLPKCYEREFQPGTYCSSSKWRSGE